MQECIGIFPDALASPLSDGEAILKSGRSSRNQKI